MSNGGATTAVKLREYIAQVLASDETKGDASWAMDRPLLERFVAIAQSSDPFLISAHDLAGWLDLRVHHVTRLLKCYVRGEDYVTVEEPPQGGRPRQAVLLSTNCFKRVLLRMRGRKAEQLRTYFILTEQMYRDGMEHNISRRVHLGDEEASVTAEKRDEAKRPRILTVPDGEEGVYVIEINDRGRVTYKVGWTAHLPGRFQELQGVHTGRLRLAHWRPACAAVYEEMCVHDMLSRDEVDQEVFATELPLILKALDICEASRKQMRQQLAAARQASSTTGVAWR